MEVKKRRSESEREKREEGGIKVERERRKVSDKKKKRGQVSVCAENQKGHFYSFGVDPSTCSQAQG